MANLALKKITDKAKILYRTGKYSKWTDAIKAASKQVSKVGDYKINKSTFVEKRKPVTPRKKTKKTGKTFLVKRSSAGTFSQIKRTKSISGTGGKDMYSVRDAMQRDLDNANKQLHNWKSGINISKDATQKRKIILVYNGSIKALKKAIIEQNKLINQLLK